MLLLNKIWWFGVATPFLYIYFILTMDQSVSRSKLMLWSFALGLVVDIFSNTFGIHAASATLIAFLRPMFLRFFFLRDENDIFEPHMVTLGTGKFVGYALICTLVHHMAVCLLEFFTLSHPLLIIFRIVACTAITMVFVLAVELIRFRKS